MIFVCVAITVTPVFSYGQPSRALETVPETEPLNFLKALDYLEVGETGPALVHLKQSLKRYPRHAPILTSYLRLKAKLKGPPDAIEAARQHVRKTEEPRLLRPFFRSLNADTELYEPLMRWLYESSYLDPYIHLLYGQLLLDSSRYRRALKVLDRAHREFPQKGQLQLRYAEALAYRGRCRQALENFRQLQKERPGWPEPYLMEARVFWSRKRTKAREALTVYRSLTSSAHVPEASARTVFFCPNLSEEPVS